jgi:hypothetical protein
MSSVSHVYTVCFFTPGMVVPWVKLVDAENDVEAVDLAQWMEPNTTREVWDRHRLVSVIPAMRQESRVSRYAS